MSSTSKIKREKIILDAFPLIEKQFRERTFCKNLNTDFTFRKFETNNVTKIKSNFKLEKKNEIKTLRFQIFPNKYLQSKFRENFDIVRLIYNSCIKNRIEKDVCEETWLYRKFVSWETCEFSQEIKEKYKNVNTNVKYGAIKEFLTAKKAALSNMEAGNINHFEIGFRKF